MKLKKYKKIYILGTSGSGKTWLSRKISSKLDISYYDLDDIEWKEKYTKRREGEEKFKEINKILKRKKWIIEGVYEYWTEKAVDESEIVIWLRPKLFVLKFRLFKRYLQSKFSKKKFDLGGLKTLLKFVKAYCDPSGKNPACQGHKKLAERDKKKLIVLRTKKEVNKFLNTLK